jgi:hypothetical protein
MGAEVKSKGSQLLDLFLHQAALAAEVLKDLGPLLLGVDAGRELASSCPRTQAAPGVSIPAAATPARLESGGRILLVSSQRLRTSAPHSTAPVAEAPPEAHTAIR